MGRELNFRLTDFSGGWNCRDAPSQVADNESPDCFNVNFDERGGVVKRLGYEKLNPDDELAGPPKRVFFWATAETSIVQVGATLYKTTDFESYTSIKTFSSDDLVGLCDFQELLVVCHPVDGTWWYDGSSFTQSTGGATVLGNTCAAWQNKVWVSGVTSQVWFSNIGDPKIFTVASDYVFLREHDGTKVVCLGVGNGVNIIGEAGLLAFKEHSVHRIEDASNGSFSTLSTMAGAAGPLAVASSRAGLICFIGRDGIFVTDGVQAPTLVSRKIEPLFQPDQLNFEHLDRACATAFCDRVVFSMPRGVSEVNNFMLEYHPVVGWFAPHNLGFSDLTEFNLGTCKLYGGDPTDGFIHDVFTGWDDNGAEISCRWQSKWFTPADMVLCRYRRLIVEGRGEYQLYVKYDYSQGTGTLFEVENENSGFIWNQDDWNDINTRWGPTGFETISKLWSLGTGRAISIEMAEESSASALAPRLLGDGASNQIGAVATYGLRFDLFQLGLA